MILHRPPFNLVNGCGATALAATLGGPPETFYHPYGSIRGQRYNGMTTDAILRALDDAKQRYIVTHHHRAKRLSSVLPTTGRGMVTVSNGRDHHVLAFYGHLVYDVNTGGRWMWVYDYIRLRDSVREVILFQEAA